MFVRYANNILAHGAVSWNPDGLPTYGLTSNLYLIVVLPIRYLTAADASLVAWLSSCLSGCLFLALLVFLLWRFTPAGPIARSLAVLLVFYSLAGAAEHFTAHICTGMDTTFALAFLTAYLLVAKRHEETGSNRSAVLMGTLGGLAFSARPDLMLYTTAIPGFLLLFPPNRRARRQALIALAITSLLVACQVLVAAWYLRSPLPLPFYVKSLNRYDPSVYVKYWRIAGLMLVQYLRSYGLLVGLIAANFVLLAAKRRRPSPVDLGMLTATCAFLVYHRVFVLQIMFFDQRFYYPTLPALAFLAAGGVARIAQELPRAARAWLLRLPRLLYPAIVLQSLVFLFPRMEEAAAGISRGWRDPMFVFDLEENYRRAYSRYWFRLDRFMALPDDLVMATTEVGRPAVMSPGKAIVDLAGLHETHFAHHGFSAEWLFREYQPDLIYMPLPLYRRMLEQIRAHPRFVEGYDYYPRKALGARMGIALRRDSPHYGAMREIVRPGEAAPEE
jgi:hypothetical protein